MSFNFKFNINDYNIDVDIVANLDESNNEKKAKKIINKNVITFSKVANNRYINQNQFIFENANVNVMKMYKSIKNFYEKKRHVKNYTKYVKSFHDY